MYESIQVTAIIMTMMAYAARQHKMLKLAWCLHVNL